MILFLTGNVLPILIFVLFLALIIVGIVFLVLHYTVKSKMHFIWKILLFLLFVLLTFIFLLNNIDAIL